MTHALQSNDIKRRGDGLQPIRISRDLHQIASLIELGFDGRLDSQGRAAVREMSALGSLGILLLPLNLLDMLGLGMAPGFVWRVNGVVRGNVNLYRADTHPWLGPGWLIANVTTHPDYRRQGIARRLLAAAVTHARENRGNWISLQVEANNLGAIRLYESFGFQRYETLHQWEAIRLRMTAPDGPSETDGWTIRLRRTDETRQERELILRRARIGGMIWTRPYQRKDMLDTPFNSLGSLPDGRAKERWILHREDDPEVFSGSIWVNATTFSRAALTVFFDPAISDRNPDVFRALMMAAINRKVLEGRLLRLESDTAPPWMEDLLRSAGFRRTRSLVQMRLRL